MGKSEFRVEKHLGKGSYGSVSLVTRLSDGKQYALKEINVSSMKAQDRQDQLNEIRILASIYHPNVLGYYECFLENGRLCIVMDMCADGDLERLISQHQKSRTRIPEAQIWKIILQTLNGLRAIHQKKILHRDIKSANVLLQGEVCKIADFGVSKVLKQQGQLANTQIGTPYYLSPEIWQRQNYSAKTDVYSLGCLYYELCTLKHPYEGRDMRDLQRNVLAGRYQQISSFYSQELRDFVYQMMQQRPTKRPSVEALIASKSIQTRKTICPTTFDEAVLAGEETAAAFGMTSVVDAPQMLKTIKMNPVMNRVMNGQIGGGMNPRSRQYQQIEQENAKKIVGILPEPQYVQRQKWDLSAGLHVRKERTGGAGSNTSLPVLRPRSQVPCRPYYV